MKVSQENDNVHIQNLFSLERSSTDWGELEWKCQKSLAWAWHTFGLENCLVCYDKYRMPTDMLHILFDSVYK